MLGDARLPNTPLRVAAVERTPGEAIRFQSVARTIPPQTAQVSPARLQRVLDSLAQIGYTIILILCIYAFGRVVA
jgi:hypothetical protein